MFPVLGPPETPSISENSEALFDGSQASFHHDATKNIDLRCPDVKIKSETIFLVNCHGTRTTLWRAELHSRRL